MARARRFPIDIPRVSCIAALSFVLFALSGCATQRAQPPVYPPAPPVVQPLPPLPAPISDEAKFAAFVRDFRPTADAQGISGAVYNAAMGNIHLNRRVQELNSAQPEFVRPIWQYLDSAVSPRRIADGEAAMQARNAALGRIEAQYGVSKYILTAIWGMESDFGTSMGNFDMFEALATLAYDGRRVDFARPELLAALKMVQQDGFQPAAMKSSWAGAFGQTQFMPTVYLKFAVDLDGNGRPDLWNSAPDALASTANLLAHAGWVRGARWGYEVRLPRGFAYQNADIDIVKPIAEWRRLGVTTALGRDLPNGEDRGAIVLPAGARGPAFMVFDNFRNVLKYNNAISYALAVCELADRISGESGIVQSWPRDEQMLSRDERIRLQTDLKTLGFDPGPIDGVLGRKVRGALRAWQVARGLPADGFATEALLDRLNRDGAGRSS